jgi:FeS assembly protein IscX
MEKSQIDLYWTNSFEIAITLSETYPNVIPQFVRFTDLQKWVLSLPEFKDDPNHCSEKILEAIQTAWIDECN